MSSSIMDSFPLEIPMDVISIISNYLKPFPFLKEINSERKVTIGRTQDGIFIQNVPIFIIIDEYFPIYQPLKRNIMISVSSLDKSILSINSPYSYCFDCSDGKNEEIWHELVQGCIKCKVCLKICKCKRK